jgi:hypothetical protein
MVARTRAEEREAGGRFHTLTHAGSTPRSFCNDSALRSAMLRKRANRCIRSACLRAAGKRRHQTAPQKGLAIPSLRATTRVPVRLYHTHMGEFSKENLTRCFLASPCHSCHSASTYQPCNVDVEERRSILCMLHYSSTLCQVLVTTQK